MHAMPLHDYIVEHCNTPYTVIISDNCYELGRNETDLDFILNMCKKLGFYRYQMRMCVTCRSGDIQGQR